jgi:hypothetical protein
MNNDDPNKFNRSIITMAEDGMLIVWDLKKIIDYEKVDLRLKGITKWEPVCVIPFCRKNQSGGEPLGGNQIILDTKYSTVHKENKLFI